MLGWLVARRHHQGGFEVPVQAAEPAFVGKRLAQLLFVLPDLHWLAAAWTSIAVAGNDDIFLSSAFFGQGAPMRFQSTNARAGTRAFDRLAISQWELELWWHVAISRHVTVDFETDADLDQNGCRPGHLVLLLDAPGKTIGPKQKHPQVF